MYQALLADARFHELLLVCDRDLACRVRAATLYQRLAAIAATGRIVKSTDGYRLAD